MQALAAMKYDRAVQVADVGQRNRGEFVAFGQINDGSGRKGGIEKGVVAVDIQRNGQRQLSSTARPEYCRASELTPKSSSTGLIEP